MVYEWPLLVNQLVSCRLEQTVICYISAFTIPSIRILLGPLPVFVCKFASFSTIFPGINAILLSVAASGFKFAFVYIFKSIPIMNDELLTRIVVRIITVWSFFACTFKMFFEEKIAIDEVCINSTSLSIHHFSGLFLSLENLQRNLVWRWRHKKSISISSNDSIFCISCRIFFQFGRFKGQAKNKKRKSNKSRFVNVTIPFAWNINNSRIGLHYPQQVKKPFKIISFFKKMCFDKFQTDSVTNEPISNDFDSPRLLLCGSFCMGTFTMHLLLRFKCSHQKCYAKFVEGWRYHSSDRMKSSEHERFCDLSLKVPFRPLIIFFSIAY